MSVITDIIGSLDTYHVWRQVGGYNRLGKQYKALIYRRFDIGTPPELLDIKGYSDNPVTVTTGYSDKDIFDNVAGSKATIRMLADSYEHLLQIARADDTRFMVECSEDGANIFRGYIKPETYRQEYENSRPVVTVEATDGIGLLRNVDFMTELDDYSVLKGKHRVMELIGYLLWKAGNRKTFIDCINYSLTPHTDDNLLRYLEVPVFKYFGWTCYDVLIDLLKIFNAQLVQVNGIFHIRLADMPYGEECDIYTYKGVYQSSTTLDRELVRLSDYKGLQGDIRMERPVRKLNIEATEKKGEDFVFNADFALTSMVKPPKPFGWEGYGSIPNSSWWAEEKNLILKGKPFGQMGADWGVQTNISRGIHTWPAASIRLGFSFEYKKAASGIDTEIKVGILGQGGTPVPVTSTDWQTFTNSQGIGIPNNQEDIYFHISSPAITTVKVRDIKTWAVMYTTGSSDVEDRDTEEEIALQVKSQQDITHEIDYPFGGNQYRYENPFPGIRNRNDRGIIDRRTGLAARNYSIQRSRALTFFRLPRMRVSMQAYRDELPMKIDDILYDNQYKRTYVITNLSYDMSKCKYSVEALEHERVFVSEDVDDWILADGIWNDNGFWRDGAQWNDGT